MDTYLEDGLNLYAYVKNNPVKYVDPSGHCVKCSKENGVSESSNSSVAKPNQHGIAGAHVHQPTRNVNPNNGMIIGKPGSKTKNGGVTVPGAKDVKQLYDYLNNTKYH